MVNARNVNGWNMSISMLIGMSPKISFNCGACRKYNETRLSMKAVSRKSHMPFVCIVEK